MLICQKKRVASENGNVAEWFAFVDKTALEANDKVLAELEYACRKHPDFCKESFLRGLVVIMEELGETAEAVLAGDIDQVIHEAAQVAACGHRLVDYAKRVKEKGVTSEMDKGEWSSVVDSIKCVGIWAKRRLNGTLTEEG